MVCWSTHELNQKMQDFFYNEWPTGWMDNKHVVKSPQIKSLSYLGINAKTAKTHKTLEKNPYYIEVGCKPQHIKQGM